MRALKLFFQNQFAAAAAKSLQSCPTLRPHRWQPTRLLYPWDSPGKKTGYLVLNCASLQSALPSSTAVWHLCCAFLQISLNEIMQLILLCLPSFAQLFCYFGIHLHCGTQQQSIPFYCAPLYRNCLQQSGIWPWGDQDKGIVTLIVSLINEVVWSKGFGLVGGFIKGALAE